jgi:hypothetical protein
MLSFFGTMAQSSSDSLLRVYDRYWELSPGLYRVMKNGEVGVIGPKGIIVPVEYQQVWSATDNGYFRVIKKGKTGLYHINKGIVIPAEYDQIWDYSNGMARVIKDGKTGYFGYSGELIAPCIYQQIWDFKDGMARAVKDGKLGYISQQGQELIPCIYQQISTFEDGLARVVRDGKIGFVNRNGIEIVPCEYQQIWNFNNGRARAVKNNLVGYIDTTGIEVIPVIYSQIWDFDGDSARAVLNDNILYINQQGKVTSIIGTNKTISTTNQQQANSQTNSPNESIHHPSKQYTSTPSDTTRIISLHKKNIQIIENNNEKTIEFTNKDICDKKRNKNPQFKGHLFGIDVGFNNYMTSDHKTSMPVAYRFMELNSSKSIGTTIHVVQESFNISKNGSLGLVTGIGIEFNNYRFDSQYLLSKSELGQITYTIASDKIEKNKLTSVYATIPLLLEFQAPRLPNKNPFYISGGIVGGVRVKSYTKVVYSNGDKDKNRGNFNLQDFRYGFMGRIGYRFINLYSVYYPVALFKKSADPELYPFSIGFSFYPDWM